MYSIDEFKNKLLNYIKDNDYQSGLKEISLMEDYLHSQNISDEIIIQFLGIVHGFYKYFGYVDDQIQTLKFLSDLYINYNAMQNAYRTIQEAIDLAKDNNDADEFVVLNQLLFRACMADKDLNSAFEISEMLESFTSEYGIALDDEFIINTATMYLQMEKYEKAIDIYLQFLDSPDYQILFHCKLNLSICYRNVDQIEDALLLLKELENYTDIDKSYLIEYELVYAKSLIVNNQFVDAIEHIKNGINHIDYLLDSVVKLHLRRGIREKYVGRIEHLLVLIPASQMNDGILYILSFTRSNQMSDWLNILEWCDNIYKSKTISSDEKLELKKHIHNIAANGAPFLYGMLEKYDDHHPVNIDAWRWDNFSNFIEQVANKYGVPKPLCNIRVTSTYPMFVEKVLKNSIIISFYSINRTFLIIHSDKFELIKINEEVLSIFISSTIKYKLGELSSSQYGVEVEKIQTYLFEQFEESLNHIDNLESDGLFFIPDKIDFIPVLSIVFRHNSLMEKMINEKFIIKTTPILFPKSISLGNYKKILGVCDEESLALSKLEISNFKKNMNIENLVYAPTVIETDLKEEYKNKCDRFISEIGDSDILHITTHGLPIDNYADPIYASLSKNHYINTFNIQGFFYNLNYKLIMINSCHSSSSLSRRQINLTDALSELNQLNSYDTFSFPLILLLNRKSHNISSIWKTFDKYSFILSHNISKNLIENNDIEKSFSKAISTMINLDSFSIEQNLKDVYEDEKKLLLKNSKGLEQMLKHPYSYATYQLYSLF